MQYYFRTKEELLLSALGYLGEQLTARVRERIRELGPVTPRSVLGSSVLGGQRDGPAALVVLTDHLDRIFTAGTARSTPPTAPA